MVHMARVGRHLMLTLWTIQTQPWYEHLISCARVHASWQNVDPDFVPAYRWMVRQMRKRGVSGRIEAPIFAVIDAHGRGATFETGPRRHVMFDPADPCVAAACSAGVVRSNFTYTANELPAGERPTDEQIENDSYHRFDRASQLLSVAGAGRKLDLAYMLSTVVRDHDGVLNAPPALLDTRQTISRLSGASSIIIHGVKPGEDPRTATMWVILGEPSLSVAVPTWVAMGGTSQIVDGPETSPLSDAAEELRRRVYTGTDDDMRLDAARLPAIHDDTLPAEQTTLNEAAAALEGWRRDGVDVDEMRKVHEAACQRALKVLTGELAGGQ
ncbi:MAG: hypothetical protein JXO22_17665 [Phycisphaerae bacterium]|nr:hypothetical protein [Phycisphaerae bacterium]